MTQIVLDNSRPFSECRGDRQPDDPHYRVFYMQGEKVGKAIVLLPFDSEGNLVPDDGKTEPWAGRDAEGKPLTHHPLYTPAMRELLAKKQRRLASLATKADEAEETGEQEDVVTVSEDVNLLLYLQGKARYEWSIVQAAARQRYSRVFTSKKQLVEDLVLDEKLIPEDQLAPDLAKFLPAKVTG
jgi:hypothetical protein